jgi:hypothetical protein
MEQSMVVRGLHLENNATVRELDLLKELTTPEAKERQTEIQSRVSRAYNYINYAEIYEE